MQFLTLKEARKRTKLDLISDRNIYHRDYFRGLVQVRRSQMETERRYPRHKEIRESAIKFFAARKYEIYPHGIAIDGIYACPDFAIFRGNRIIFVECLTADWVNFRTVRDKEKVRDFVPIVFITENKPRNEFRLGNEYYNFNRRLQRLAHTCILYAFDPLTKRVGRYKAKE